MPDDNEPKIYTLGTSNRSIEDFIALLQGAGAEVLEDMRRFPTSRFKHFNQEELAKKLSSISIAYLYLGKELRGCRKGGYEAFLAGEKFQEGLNRREELARERRIVITCAERFPWHCHRRFISQALEQQGWRVIHIIDGHRNWLPKGSQ